MANGEVSGVPEGAMRRSAGERPRESVDVLVVGAGISGIDVAYRLQERCPHLTYAIAEARTDLGGTWDLFRYPGIRSDSDVFTLAYPFHPWRGRDAIVGGEEIRDYLGEVAQRYGIGHHIRFGTRVCSLDRSREESRWHAVLGSAAGEETLTARFVVMATGYYDYDRPHDPEIPGLPDFAGTVVHPQFWPEGLDVRGRRIAVIGSGATAVTLVPALAARGADVTMIQRTPSYVLAQPRRDALADLARRVLPPRPAHRAIGAKNAAVQWAFYRACRTAPGAMRRLLQGQATRGTGSRELVDAHLTPSYDPWDQRVCISPDGDFFAALRAGDARIVTGHIDRVVAAGVRMTDGAEVPADIVVTATGLRISLLGGVPISLDSEPVDLARSVAWNGAMLSGVPNLGFVVGYLNASWTLRADKTAILLARVVGRLMDAGVDEVVPVAPADLGDTGPMLRLDAGYLRRAAALMPRVGSRYPWAYAQDVVRDGRAARRADLDDGLRWGHSGRRHGAEGAAHLL